MAVVDAFKTIETDAAVEVALIVDSDELERLVVLVAAVDAQVHAINSKLSIINIHNRLLYMQEPHERVEFFHSESSFGTESNVSESRYYDFTNELIAETDNIFLTLKREVLPNEGQSQQGNINYAIRRAQILYKDTIPQHAAYLNKIEAPQNAKQQVALCSQKLEKLLADHEKLKNGTMIYKQFYNIYGKEFGLQSGTFSRKKQALQVGLESLEPIKQEQIKVIYGQPRQKLSAATPRLYAALPASNNEKELSSLREEIYKLKKIIEENKKNYELQIINQQLLFEKRMRTYLISQTTTGQLEKNLNEQLKQRSQKLEKLLAQNKVLNQVIQQRNKSIQMLKDQNKILQEQIELLRKTDSNMTEYQEALNKSYTSEVNNNEDKKHQKILKIIMQENELLKNQLKTERQRIYRKQNDLTDEQRRELERNRKNLEKKRSELQQLYSDFDKQRVQILQLSHSCKTNQKLVQTLKRQNQDLKEKLARVNTAQGISPAVLSFQNSNHQSIQTLKSSKLEILQYEGDGIQGFPYYQILSKQFKIRYKRSCLKEKELLYKSNGIQIGVISNFVKPNKIDILVHLTNYSQNKFQKVKVKVMNANQNKIQGNAFDYATLAENEQVKIPITIAIHQYPIGPLILLLQYTSDKKEEIRILLPAHIFKMMVIDEREEEINNTNSTQLSLSTERKICRDISDLKKYLKIEKVTNGVMKAVLFNQHTHTLFYLDIHQTANGIDLIYEHKEGNKNITEYFIKTFAFLIGKDTIK